jgi:hypothetical protein
MRRNIFARIHEKPYWPYIEVFDWERTTSSSHCKAIIFPGVKTVRFTIPDPLSNC